QRPRRGADRRVQPAAHRSAVPRERQHARPRRLDPHRRQRPLHSGDAMSTKLSRRLVLRGFGGMAIAMPMLEAIHDKAWAQSAPAPKRFVTFFEHGGTLTNHTAGVFGYDGFTDGTSEIQGMNGWRPVS